MKNSSAEEVADENEFVIIEHPKSTASLAEKSKTDGNKPAFTKISNQPMLELDTPFGSDQQKQEEEPVIISSLSGSEHSSGSAPVLKQKKPPAPPPQPKTSAKSEFDSIFGVSTLPADFTEGFDNDFFANNGETSEEGHVTPIAISAEKAVPSASTPFEAKPEQTQFNNAFNNSRNKVDDNHETQNSGVQDSLHSSSVKGETTGVNKNARGVDGTPVVKKEESAQSFDHKDKKKKKKNIVSWAKSFGGFDSDKKKKKQKAGKKKQLPNEHPIVTETSRPGSTHSRSIHRSIEESSPRNDPPVFDVSTIQGSHIAELVNMGFEPTAALEALDRYDQDLEKATNFLLDQA